MILSKRVNTIEKLIALRDSLKDKSTIIIAEDHPLYKDVIASKPNCSVVYMGMSRKNLVRKGEDRILGMISGAKTFLSGAGGEIKEPLVVDMSKKDLDYFLDSIERSSDSAPEMPFPGVGCPPGKEKPIQGMILISRGDIGTSLYYPEAIESLEDCIVMYPSISVGEHQRHKENRSFFKKLMVLIDLWRYL